MTILIRKSDKIPPFLSENPKTMTEVLKSMTSLIRNVMEVPKFTTEVPFSVMEVLKFVTEVPKSMNNLGLNGTDQDTFAPVL
jgi:hypothetical protein